MSLLAALVIAAVVLVALVAVVLRHDYRQICERDEIEHHGRVRVGL